MSEDADLRDMCAKRFQAMREGDILELSPEIIAEMFPANYRKVEVFRSYTQALSSFLDILCPERFHVEYDPLTHTYIVTAGGTPNENSP